MKATKKSAARATRGNHNQSTTSYLVKVAVLTAMSLVLHLFLHFPLMPPPYNVFDLDFAEVPALLGGFALGPTAAILIEVIKVVLKIAIKGLSFGGVGDLSNLIVNLAFVVPAAVLYRFMRSRKGGLVALIVGFASLLLVSSLSNYFIIVPLVGKVMPVYLTIKTETVLVGLGFNAIKGIVNGGMTFLLYKKLSPILKFNVFAKKTPLYGVHTVKNLRETDALARRFAAVLKGSAAVLMAGDLGAGKTTFTKSLFRALGATDTVTSPTFTIMKKYRGTSLNLYHFDLYRIEDVSELEELGFDELIGEADSISVVEWNKITDINAQIYTVDIVRTGDTARAITIAKVDTSAKMDISAKVDVSAKMDTSAKMDALENIKPPVQVDAQPTVDDSTPNTFKGEQI